MRINFNRLPQHGGPGVCRICKKGPAHSAADTGQEDLVMLTVVER